MNKKIMLSLVLCLILSFSLYALPAFADGTVIVIGGSLNTESGSSVVTNASSASSTVVSGSGSSNTVIVTGKDTSVSPAASAETAMLGSVVVMPNGTMQTVSSNPVSQTQSQSVVQGQQAQSASAQTASNAVVVGAQQDQTAAAQAAANVLAAPAGLANDIVTQINAQRAANGLRALSYSDALQASADTRARESAQVFSHLRPDGSGCETAVTVDYLVTGENLIQVTSEFATASVMVETWMNSPTHRNNILLSGFSEIAVGIYVSNGITYVSTVFAGY